MKEPKHYNPSTNYYMLSFFDSKDVRHIRCPFLTKDEVDAWYKVFLTSPQRYENLEVFREETLDIVSKYKMTEEYDDEEMTLREAIFGPNYQWYAEYFRSGEIDGMYR